jgi:hypothetical protein
MDLETMFVLDHLNDDEIIWNKNVWATIPGRSIRRTKTIRI